jgi:hypothetical protein
MIGGDARPKDFPPHSDVTPSKYALNAWGVLAITPCVSIVCAFLQWSIQQTCGRPILFPNQAIDKYLLGLKKLALHEQSETSG